MSVVALVVQWMQSNVRINALILTPESSSRCYQLSGITLAFFVLYKTLLIFYLRITVISVRCFLLNLSDSELQGPFSIFGFSVRGRYILLTLPRTSRVRLTALF